jgi:ribosomal protein L11 methyltransferase
MGEGAVGVLNQPIERTSGAMPSYHGPSIRAGRRVLTIPANRSEIIPAPGDVPIWLLPQGAFGNGTHPTTRIAVTALEDFLTPGERVLDLGSGSGILSIAAIKLGAASALGLEVSPEAVRTARANIRLNGVEDAARAQIGSLDSLLDHRFGQPDPTFDLVVANILTPVILGFIRAGIVRTLRPGGRLIVTGLVERDLPRLRLALRRSGLKLVGRYRGRSAWIGLVLRPELPWSIWQQLKGGVGCLLNRSTRS